MTYLDFIEAKTETKTKKYFVYTRGAGQLGCIKWFSRWRRYAFFPNPVCVFDASCLREIESYLTGLMDERKHG